MKEPIERAYGLSFYAEMEKVAEELRKNEASEKEGSKRSSSAKASEDKRKK